MFKSRRSAAALRALSIVSALSLFVSLIEGEGVRQEAFSVCAVAFDYTAKRRGCNPLLPWRLSVLSSLITICPVCLKEQPFLRLPFKLTCWLTNASCAAVRSLLPLVPDLSTMGRSSTVHFF
jgi:hypothetical protein